MMAGVSDPRDPGCRAGEVIQVKLASVPQFTDIPHHLKLSVTDRGLKHKYGILNDEIQKAFKFKPHPSPLQVITPNQKCIVQYLGYYRRAVVKSLFRVDIAKVFLLDTSGSAMVHVSQIYSTTTLWSLFEPRVITCKLQGLSSFASGFHLRHILQNQIDWKGKLKVTITKSGVIPTVHCYSTTYPEITVNQVVLNYLYRAYDPNRLIRLYPYWPSSRLSTALDGHLAIEIDTPLLQHVKKQLTFSKIISKGDIPLLTRISPGAIYLGQFHQASFERCTLSRVSKFGKISVHFIDSGRRIEYDKHYPFRVIAMIPAYPALTSIPPLCVEVKLNGLEDRKELGRQLESTVKKRIQVTVEIVQEPTETTPTVVDIFEALSSVNVNYNNFLARELTPGLELPLNPFLVRQFSSLHNFSMPLQGHNWGIRSQRIFELSPGTRFYGVVTQIGLPGNFIVRPLKPLPLPKVEKAVLNTEIACGCLWDGQFFRVKEDQLDERNVRVRLLSPISLPEPLKHMTRAMEKVKVKTYNVDDGEVRNVPVLHLRKMGPKTAAIPPRIAYCVLHPDEPYFTHWSEFEELLDHTLFLEVTQRQIEETVGMVALTVKIISKVMNAKGMDKESHIVELEY